MQLSVIRAKIDTDGVDISGENVVMAAGTTHIVRTRDLPYYEQHGDAFEIVSATPALLLTDANGNITGLEAPNSAGRAIRTLAPRRTAVRVALFGDSTASPSFWNSPANGADTEYYATAAFPASGATVLSGHTFEKWPLGVLYPKAKLVAPFGVSGENTTQMLARSSAVYSTTRRAVEDVWLTKPDAIFLRAGINDVQALNASSSQAAKDAIKTNIQELAYRLAYGGSPVVIEGMYGLSTAIAAPDLAFCRAAIVEINAASKAFAAANPRTFEYLETSGVTHDGTGAYKSGMTSDGIHCSPAGGLALGAAEQALLTRMFGYGNIQYEGNNLITNAFLLSTSGVSYGTVATGFSAAHSHATYQNAQIIKRNGIRYQTCEFVADGTAGAYGQLNFPWTPQSWGFSANAVIGCELDFFIESAAGGAPQTPVTTSLFRLDNYKSGAGRVVLDQASISYAVDFAGAVSGHMVFAPFKCQEPASNLTSSSNGFLKYFTNVAGTFRLGIGNLRAVLIA